jgi:transposase-like protein
MHTEILENRGRKQIMGFWVESWTYKSFLKLQEESHRNRKLNGSVCTSTSNPMWQKCKAHYKQTLGKKTRKLGRDQIKESLSSRTKKEYPEDLKESLGDFRQWCDIVWFVFLKNKLK